MRRKWYVHDFYTNGLAKHPHAQLSAIASLHDRHYIHRDIKPSNFMTRAAASDVTPTIFLIDFGLARQFRDPATYLHIPSTTKHSIIGTLPFTSVNGQRGYAQSCRDDLESLAYTIIFLARGELPWSSRSICKDPKAVLQKKMSITAEELCEGLPPPFSKFVIYVRSLGFDKEPDYDRLQTILSDCLETETDHLKAPPSTPPSLGANRTSSPSVAGDRV
jgi:casein kinase 1